MFPKFVFGSLTFQAFLLGLTVAASSKGLRTETIVFGALTFLVGVAIIACIVPWSRRHDR